jgi:hypothetical protein
MKQVFQTKLHSSEGIHNGNCLAACLASLLEIPLWMVPPFEDMFARDDWRVRIDDWLGRMFDLSLARVSGHDLTKLPEFYIACGLSSRGVGHAVIYRKGAFVHDPHLSGEGIQSVEWCWYLKEIGAKNRL